jgi:uncharacterized protein
MFREIFFSGGFLWKSMKIQVQGLSEGLHEYLFDIPSVDLGLTEEFSGDVKVRVSLDKTQNEIVLSAQLSAAVHLECDRCTRPFVLELDPGYRMVYVWEGEDTSLLDPSEVQVISPGLSVIDLSEDVRQTLVLALPFKRVCTEQCRGLCPHCGKNLNEEPCGCRDSADDSRWEKLKNVKFSKNDEA